MPNYIYTLQSRLAGNLYDNRYYISQLSEEAAIAAATAIQSAQAVLQTGDVEYVGGLLTLVEGSHITIPVPPFYANGQQGGLSTLPATNFLEFVFYSTGNRRKVTHRVRGCGANSATELGVFNAGSTGVGDYDSGGSIPETVLFSGYSAYLATVAEFSTDPDFLPITWSTRISVGFKRAGRSL